MAQAAVGISIGMRNSSVAVLREYRVTVLANGLGSKLTPSYVALVDNAFVCGEEALNRLDTHPGDTFYEIKGFIGRDPDSDDLPHHCHLWPFNVKRDFCRGDASPESRYKYYVRGDQGPAGVDEQEMGGLFLHPEYVMAVLIAKMKSMAEAFLGIQNLTEAVLTVPASIGGTVRMAIKQAAIIAGFTTVYLLNEPTAIALAYSFEQRMLERETQDVLVCNMGAGASDATVFSVDSRRVVAKATAGLANLGGVNLTNAIAGFLEGEILCKHRPDMHRIPACARRRLRKVAERVKRELSSRVKSQLRVEGLLDDLDFQSSVSRAEFEMILASDNRFRDSVATCIQESGVPLEEVLLAGGSSRIPYMRNMIREVTGMASDSSMHAEHSVAVGAAVKAANINGACSNFLGGLQVMDVASMTIKTLVEPAMEYTVVRKNDPIACQGQQEIDLEVAEIRPVVKVYEGDEERTTMNGFLGEIHFRFPEDFDGRGSLTVFYEVDACGVLHVSRAGHTPAGGSWRNLDFKFERLNLTNDAIITLARRFPGADLHIRNNDNDNN